MKILVCGAQVPFASGGAELAVGNLVAELQSAGHSAELVRLPTAWDKVRVFDAALAWRMVPLDADLVICTNFPSYFASHPNKVAWVFHQHRTAYDGIDQPWSDFGLDEASIELQRLLTTWDNQALSEATRLFSISGVVADRLLRFNGLLAEPLHHPPPLHDRLRRGPYGDYIFCASRLEQNKRPDLLVSALAHSEGPVRLVIAGTGSMRAELLEIAAAHNCAERLELVGFVDDEVLIDLYAGARAVAYAPFDEDYGYVTLQAFLAGKPVITAHDSGGVLEWVVDGVTGVVTDGTPAAVGRAYDLLAADEERAGALGEAGYERAAALEWRSVVDALLGS